MTNPTSLPVVVVGAGPVGLAAAAHLIERDIPTVVLEAGERIAASMETWRHVRLFTPWSFLVDPASRRLLEASGTWSPPAPDDVPLAGDLIDRYLAPLADLEPMRSALRLQHRVIAMTRAGHDRMRDGSPSDRSSQPFVIVAETPSGRTRIRARAIIDASGTWANPNPMGAGGVEADGEATHRDRIHYGMPDVLGRASERYGGKRVLVVGSGHSAIGTVLNLVELATDEPDTRIAWAIRGSDPRKLWGGGAADEVTERGALGTRVHDAVATGRVTLHTDFSIATLREHPEGLAVIDVADVQRVVVDEIVVATGARPDVGICRELRTEFDPATEASRTLGPMIDPNHHSCGSVRPHGAKELAHPEKDFYIVGMKSYGRAPTFLLRTGYEQVRSVVAELAGDHEAASRVELVLPQTGVCSTNLGPGTKVTARGCC